MYKQTQDTKYRAGVSYYSKSGNIYTLLVAGTDYTVGNTITGTKYNRFDYDKVYINAIPFPYTPQHDAGQNDVDLDAYTNTKGYTIRNRVRHDVKTLDFNIPTITGAELRALLQLRNPVWFQCTFFDEAEWDMVTKKMYCSSPKYTKYFIDESNPDKNIYTDVQFGFVEQ